MVAFCLCIVVAATGGYRIVEEGPNDRPSAEHSHPDTGVYTVPTSRLNIHAVGTTESEEVGVERRESPSVPDSSNDPDTPSGVVVDVVPTGEPASVAVPPPVPVMVEVGCTTEIVCAYPWDCATAMRIVACETGGTFSPYVVGKAEEEGCFQIHPIHWGKPQCSGDLFDPAYNIACAYSIWVGQGWWPWSCY